MRFGTYMLVGGVLAGLAMGGYIRERHVKCPKEHFELNWDLVQIAVVWPALVPLSLMLPSDLPKTPCRED